MLICRENIFYAFDFAVVSGTRSYLAIDAGANTNVGGDSRGAFSMDGGVAVVYGLRDLGPWALKIGAVTTVFGR